MRMVVVLLSLLIFSNIVAQKTTLGLEQHVGVSCFTSGLLSYNPKLSSSTGLIIEKPISDHFNLQSGLYYQNAGAKSEIFYPGTSGQIKVTETARQSFLRIPAIIKVRIGPQHRFFIGAGGYFNYNLGTKIFSDNDVYPGPHSFWTSFDLDQHEFGIILKQVLCNSFERFCFTCGLQEEIGLNPSAPETLPYGISAFIGITLHRD
jgi:hypothetical protein